MFKHKIKIKMLLFRRHALLVRQVRGHLLHLALREHPGLQGIHALPIKQQLYLNKALPIKEQINEGHPLKQQ